MKTRPLEHLAAENERWHWASIYSLFVRYTFSLSSDVLNDPPSILD